MCLPKLNKNGIMCFVCATLSFGEKRQKSLIGWWKECCHLGGQFNSYSTFSLELSVLQRQHKRPFLCSLPRAIRWYHPILNIFFPLGEIALFTFLHLTLKLLGLQTNQGYRWIRLSKLNPIDVTFFVSVALLLFCIQLRATEEIRAPLDAPSETEQKWFWVFCLCDP